MRLLQGFALCCLLLLCSLSPALAQKMEPLNVGDLEVITPTNLERLVMLRDLETVQHSFFSEMSFNANSTLLAASVLGGVWIWSLDTGHATVLVEPHGDPIYSPAVFSPTDPNRLATCNVMWDVSKLQPFFEGDFCSQFAFAPNGHFFVTGRPLRLLNADTGALVRELPQEIKLRDGVEPIDGLIYDTAFSPNDEMLAYCTNMDDGNGISTVIIQILNLDTEETKSLPTVSHSPRTGWCPYQQEVLFFSLDSRYLHTNIDFGFTTFDTETDNLIFSPEPWGGHFVPTPDQQILFDYVADWGGKPRLTAYTMDTLAELSLPADMTQDNVAVSPDGKLLATFNGDHILIWGVSIN